MKFIKYLILSMVLFSSCDKHEILYNNTLLDENIAEFQLHYFEPIENVAANYIDSVYINNVLYSSVNGSGQLLPYNGVPGGATGRFFSVNSGNVNIKFYRKDNIVYDRDVTLQPGKQNIFVHDMTKDPIIIDNLYPYIPNDLTATTTEWGTDSIAMVRFYNFLYEDAHTPYPGRLQYQYQDARTKEWKNLGAAVAFGEATERVTIRVVKSVNNSSGYCRIDYRILDENGEILQVLNSNNRMVDYSDWWNAYIGRAYMHIFSGIRTQKPVSSVKVWTSL